MKNLMHPDRYHGHPQSTDFFEGWYFKIVKDHHCFAIIPGISLGSEENTRHSFIQIINGHDVTYDYLQFQTDAFMAHDHPFRITIGANTFSLDQIHLDLEGLSGDLSFSNGVKWPDTLLNPGSMGFYNYLTFMECYSQVCLLEGYITGHLKVDGDDIDFRGGKVYIEKNWGKSFPKSWLWIQSHHFPQDQVSVTCSLATIPFPLGEFQGFLIGVTVGKQFFSFTTINRSKLSILNKGRDIVLDVTKGPLLLRLETFSDPNTFVLCKGPQNGAMAPLVKETLSGSVYMRLENIKDHTILFEGTGHHTGIEYGGENVW